MASRAGPSAAQREEGEARRDSVSRGELVKGVWGRESEEGGVMVQRQWVREGRARVEGRRRRGAKSAMRVGVSILVLVGLLLTEVIRLVDGKRTRPAGGLAGWCYRWRGEVLCRRSGVGVSKDVVDRGQVLRRCLQESDFAA